MTTFSFSETNQKVDKALEHLHYELNLLRTGRAAVQMLDPVSVEVYGSRMKVSEVATVSAPDPSLLMISPWDKSILEAVSKAIASSGLNVNPVVDGDIIRISVPPLTEERRKEMVKLLQQKTEQVRVMVRTIRSDAKRDIEKQKGQDGVSEDDIELQLSELEEVIKTAMEKIEQIASEKEKELMTV